MRLLDVANVNPRPGSRAPADGRWAQGYNTSARSCSVQMEIEDPCGGEANGVIVGDITDAKACYFVQPFPVRSFLRMSTKREQPDDKDWFGDAARAKLEYVAGKALVTQVFPTAVTWIGDAGVQSVALAGTSAAQYRTAVADAFDLWQSTVVDPIGDPLLHVPPRLVPDLIAANILTATSPTDLAAPGFTPKVVSSPGYDANAKIFFTGEVIVRMSDVDDEGGPLYTARINNLTFAQNQVMAIDVPPCSIVRVGP